MRWEYSSRYFCQFTLTLDLILTAMDHFFYGSASVTLPTKLYWFWVHLFLRSLPLPRHFLCQFGSGVISDQNLVNEYFFLALYNFDAALPHE